METITYTLPAYWASYLVNMDDSGISDEDKSDANNFLARQNLKLNQCSGCGDSYFSWHNDGNALGGDVCDYTFLI